MGLVRMYTIFTFVWLLIASTASIDPPDFPKPDGNQCPNINNINDRNSVLNTFVANLVQAFGDQAEDHRHQFAALILVPPNLNDLLNMPFEPSDDNRQPLVDNTHALSPVSWSDRVNYVVSRPENDGINGEVHAEVLVLEELQLLLFRFRCHYGEDPAAIILYTWIFPCDNCFRAIAHELDIPTIPRMLLYSTLGLHGLSGDELEAQREQNNIIINFLRGIGIFSMHVRCYVHPHSQLKRAIVDDTCENPKSVQSCLFNKLLGHSEAYCGSPENQKSSVVANVVNRLMKACGEENFKRGCGKRYLLQQGVLSGACGKIQQRHESDQFLRTVGAYVDDCLADGSLIISKPLSTEDPWKFTGVLSKMHQLDHNEYNIPCDDHRREGLFCSHWKSEYLSAGNGVCSTRCGHLGDTGYRWCNLIIGSWNYCCDEGERCVDGYCKSGNTKVWCFGDSSLSWIAQDGRDCMSYTPCGFHNGVRYTKWCFVDNKENWEYCEK